MSTIEKNVLEAPPGSRSSIKAVSTLFVARALPLLSTTRRAKRTAIGVAYEAGSARPTYLVWLGLAAWVFALSTLSQSAFAAPASFDALRAAYVPSDRIIVDRDGAPIQRIRVDDKVRRTAWTTLDEISPALIDAVLASEDKRFFEHGGVDLRAAAAAALGNLRAGSAQRGASSISMQVAAMLDASLTRASDGRTVKQKIDQAQAAWALERAWTKQQIFEIGRASCRERV